MCNCHDGETEKLRVSVVWSKNRGRKRQCRGLTLGRENLQAAEDNLVKVAMIASAVSMRDLRNTGEWSYIISMKIFGRMILS